MRPAVVLLSGGLDSATVLAHTLVGGPVAAAVFVDYGQRHIREQAAAVAVAEHYRVPLVLLDLRGYGVHLAGALTAGGDLPSGHYADPAMAATVVPNRNATLISAAAAIAADRGADRVVTAVHAGDGPVYPDCRPEFIAALSTATQLGCGVAVTAPFQHHTKAGIAAEAARLHVPIAVTWSCYAGGVRHCGRCGACVERAEALAGLDAPDPTGYLDGTYWRSTAAPAA